MAGNFYELKVPSGFWLIIKKIVLGVFMFIVVLGSYAVVPPGHRGIVIHAGKVSQNVLDEGFTFKIPFYTTIKPVSIRIQESSIKTQAASKDLQKVHTTLSINWHISPDKVNDVFSKIGEAEVIETNIIDKAASEVLKAATATMSAEDILARRIELKNTIDHELILRLKQFNISVDAVNLADFDFENEFNKAVEEKQVAEQKAKKAIYDTNRAEQEAHAEVKRAEGTAKAQALMKQSITGDLIRKLAVEKWDGKLPDTMVLGKDGAVPFFDLKKTAARVD